VSPAVRGLATPFTDRRTCAGGNGERTLVAWRFNDGVVVGREQGVIEEEDGLFGGRNDHNLIRVDLRIDGGENFAEPRRAGRFRVPAPVFEESVMCAGFEREQLFDGLRFGVGRRKQVFGGEFVLAHVLFDAKGSNLHEGECAKARGKRLEPN